MNGLCSRTHDGDDESEPGDKPDLPDEGTEQKDGSESSGEETEREGE